MTRSRRSKLHLSAEKQAALDQLLSAQGFSPAPAERITRRPHSRHAPLSFAQQRLWFLDQWSPGTATYNMAGLLRLEGPLNLIALAQAFNEIVSRHEVLRTRFDFVDGHPRQVISETLNVPLPLVDLSGLPSATRVSQAQRLSAAEARQPFDLSKLPLLRVKLLRLHSQEHLCVLVVHHIVSDLWSFGVLLQEVTALYAAFSEGSRSPLGELTVQYADFAVWQKERIAGAVLKRLTDYWKSQLADAVAVLNLPSSRPRSVSLSHRGARCDFRLDREVTQALKALSRTENVTLFMTLLAAFQILLYRYTGQSDICVGSPVAGRLQLETEPLIGCFVNPLVMRGRLNDKLTCRELLGQVRKTSLEAEAHAEMPYERLVEELQPQRDLSRNPLFQVMLVMHNTPTPKLARLRVTPEALETETSRLDLTIFFSETKEGLKGSIEYNRDLYDAAFIERLSEQLQRVLRSLPENVERRIGEVQLLSRREREFLLRECNASERARGRTLLECFAEQVRERADAIAVVAEQQVTYAWLEQRANELAADLRRRGLGAEARVGVYLERSVWLMVALLGVAKAGAAYVPLEPRLPWARLEWQLSHGEVKLLLTERKLREQVPAGISVPVLAVDGTLRATESRAAGAEESEWEERLAYLMYTSGTTGEPKGVGVSWGALDNFLQSMERAPGMSSADVMLAVTTVSFDIAGLELWLPLREGGRLEIATAAEVVDGPALARRMRESGVTVMQGTPALWRLLLLAGWERQAGLRVLCGGERWSGELAAALWERSEQVWNMYGPTETTIWSAARMVEKAEERIAIGGVIDNTQMYVLDEGLELSGLGMWGEVWIGGAGLARGYEKRADLTAERYRPDPYSGGHGQRLYGTGDVGRVGVDGRLELSGRKDEQVKVRGHRVELGEVESELRRVAGVRQAVVVAQEDGSGEQRLVGYVVKESAIGDWRSWLRERLPEYMIPSLVVELDQLPLTANGKIDRRALPAPDKMTSQRTFVPLTTEIEQSIAGIWQEVLQLPRVGAHDNFFDIGGHSLLAAEVRNKLSKLLHRDLPMVDLFRYPTVRSLAQYLGESTKSDPTAKPASQRAQASKQATNNSIAIIGMGLRFPGARTIEEYWANLRGGVESISELSAEELERAGVTEAEKEDPQYVKRVPLKLAEVESFDAQFFGFSPREAMLTDPQQRVLLETAWEALENAGYDVERYAGEIGVWAGAGVNRYLLENLLPEREWLDQEVGGLQVWLGNEKDFLSTRVSYKLNLHGPSMSVNTACSTSLVAVHLACQSLLSGECQMALAGGVSVRVPERTGYRYQPGGVYSPDGHCRPFDERAGGTLFGSGAGLVVLKRLADAERDGDTIWAVIRGTAINNDGGRKVGYTAPSVQGQAAVIAEALAMAQVEAETIGYVEAHGTGTELGDPIEVAALGEVFGSAGVERRCALGSVKANFGHLDTAAGVAGLMKVVLALKHGEKPPQLNFERANAGLELSRGGFYVNVELERWESERRRRAGVSSFGIGGTNAHVVVEEWRPAEVARGDKGREWQLLLLSGRSEAALGRQSEQLQAYLAGAERAELADVAYTLAVGRKRFSERRYVVCRNYDEAIAALAGESLQAGPAHTDDPNLVFMFPGQGTQRVNMGRELYALESTFRYWIDYCSELLQSELHVDLRSLLYPKDEERETATEQLKETFITQPALFVTEYALAKLWMSWGLNPSAMIGHSLGEYVAACLAGVMSLEDALSVVAFRARLMQSMPEGAMMAVNISEDEARTLIGDSLSLACVNGPASCVVSGPRRVIQALETKLTEEGVVHHRVQVSHAFHSALMDGAVDAFAARMKKVRLHPPQIPFLSNTTGSWIADIEATDPNYWARHMRRTVRFSDGLQTLQQDHGKRLLLEVGFGQVLGKLASSVLDDGNAVFSSIESQTNDEEFQLLGTLGKLWQAGLQPDWSGFYGPERRRVPLPTYPFERQRYWLDAGGARRSRIDSRSSLGKKTSDWFSVPVWKQSVSPHLLSRAYTLKKKSSWLVFKDEAGLGACLIDRLKSEGQTVTAVVPGKSFRRLADELYEIDPGHPRDYQSLLREISLNDELPQFILNLWGVTQENSSTAGRTAFHSLVFLAQAQTEQQRENQPVRIAVITNNLQQVSGTDKVAPEKALVLGPCRVIPQEYEGVVCQSIDVVLDRERPEQLIELAEQIIIELGDERPEPVVAYRGPQRWVQGFDLVRLADRTPDYRQEGVYLITGGLGGVGLVLANELALSARAKLILIGRSAFPDRAEWQQWLDTHAANDDVSVKIRKLQVMEEAGAEILVLSADVTDPLAMHDVVARGIERFGHINGVIHAAGVAPQGLIQRKTADDISAILSAKVSGTEVLLSVLKDLNVDFVVLCSSIRSLAGGPGAVDYCAANAFLDAIAQSVRPSSGRVISINWDGWKGTGMAAHSPLQVELMAGDDGGLTPEEGVEAFRLILASSLRQVIVSTTDLGSVIERARNFNLVKSAVKTVQPPVLKLNHPRPNLSTSYVDPRNETERILANIWQKSLGIEMVGMLDNFFELGGDSTISIQIVAEAYRTGLRLSANQIFQYPTIAELAGVAVAANHVPETKQTTSSEAAAFGWEQDQFEEILASIGQSTSHGNGHEQ